MQTEIVATKTAYEKADEEADAAINMMVGGAVGAALIPAHVNWALYCAGLSAGVCAIGKCYGITLDGKDGWKVAKQLLFSGGVCFLGLNLGTKFIAAALSSTGIGHVGAVAIDGVISGASAWAIGGAAKAYFKGEQNNEKLGHILRTRFKQAKSNPVILQQHQKAS